MKLKFYTNIVSTNYATVYDVIKHEETGLITEMTEASLSDNIYRLLKDQSLYHQITENLKKKNWDNSKEVEKYISLID